MSSSDYLSKTSILKTIKIAPNIYAYEQSSSYTCRTDSYTNQNLTTISPIKFVETPAMFVRTFEDKRLDSQKIGTMGTKLPEISIIPRSLRERASRNSSILFERINNLDLKSYQAGENDDVNQ